MNDGGSYIGLIFEWDDENAGQNFEKHGVSL